MPRAGRVSFARRVSTRAFDAPEAAPTAKGGSGPRPRFSRRRAFRLPCARLPSAVTLPIVPSRLSGVPTQTAHNRNRAVVREDGCGTVLLRSASLLGGVFVVPPAVARGPEANERRGACAPRACARARPKLRSVHRPARRSSLYGFRGTSSARVSGGEGVLSQ